MGEWGALQEEILSSKGAMSEMRQGGEMKRKAVSEMPQKSCLFGAAGISKPSGKAVVWL